MLIHVGVARESYEVCDHLQMVTTSEKVVKVCRSIVCRCRLIHLKSLLCDRSLMQKKKNETKQMLAVRHDFLLLQGK